MEECVKQPPRSVRIDPIGSSVLRGAFTTNVKTMIYFGLLAIFGCSTYCKQPFLPPSIETAEQYVMSGQIKFIKALHILRSTSAPAICSPCNTLRSHSCALTSTHRRCLIAFSESGVCCLAGCGRE
eukprot:4754671-Pleurochrysis_carterae.AAC.1